MISMERISILHDELTPAQQSETRSFFITEFGFGLDKPLMEDAYMDFTSSRTKLVITSFMGGTKRKFTVVAILKPHQLWTIGIPASRFLPEFGLLQSRHQQFHFACIFQSLPERSPRPFEAPFFSKRHKTINPAGVLSHKSCT